MSLEPDNEETYKQILTIVAERYKELLFQTIMEMKLESYTPKEQNFLSSITIIYERGAVYVGSTIPYSKNIEDGRQRGSHVPLQPLRDWLMNKLGMDEDKAKVVAYAVEQKIYNEGIKARRPFKATLYKMRGGMQSG